MAHRSADPRRFRTIIRCRFSIPLRAARLLAALALAIAVWGPIAKAGDPVTAERQMVVAAHPLAAAAGLEMLRTGGNAADAAVAVIAMLTLVEPQESGIGGGGFMLHYDAAANTVAAYNGREAALASARTEMFLDADGRPRKHKAIGGEAVAVPGLLRMLEAAHKTHGKLPWARLFRPVIERAEKGFALSERVHKAARRNKSLRRFPVARAYFYDADGNARPAGTIMRNPALAETMRAVAAGGADAFYRGPIARDIAAAVSNAAIAPVPMTEADLTGYRISVGEAPCLRYRQLRVCAAAPPSSGVTTLQTLGILASFNLAALKPGSVEAVHLIAEASRLAYADRLKYVTDPIFAPVPVAGLLDRDYLAGRAALISMDRAMDRPDPGDPPRKASWNPAPTETPESPSTSHTVIVDAHGNAVSMTATVGRAFGSKIMVRGLILNDTMNAASRRPTFRGAPAANRIEPGKRPRSTMTPVLVFDADNRLRLAVGSPGGVRIVSYVVKALVGVVDWGLDMQRAIDLPNFSARTNQLELERGSSLAGLESGLENLGHKVKVKPLTSGLAGVRIGPGKLEGGADRRREGVVLVD